MESNTIILTLRIDYEHDGRDPQHAETAARMAVRKYYDTIESGVSIKRVAVAENGVELFSIDTGPEDLTPRQAERPFINPLG